MAGRPSRLPKFLLVLAALVLVAYVSRGVWLRWLGRALIHDDGPAKADIAVVLAGDYWGNRITRAAELVREGYVPVALVDGPHGFYGTDESELAVAYITQKGYPAGYFVRFPINANSTEEEAHLVIPELQRRNVHSYLLVTSDFHSGRAGRTFRKVQRQLHYDGSMRIVVARDHDFNPDHWWYTRQGKKAAFIEWSKTFAAALGQ